MTNEETDYVQSNCTYCSQHVSSPLREELGADHGDDDQGLRLVYMCDDCYEAYIIVNDIDQPNYDLYFPNYKTIWNQVLFELNCGPQRKH